MFLNILVLNKLLPDYIASKTAVIGEDNFS